MKKLVTYFADRSLIVNMISIGVLLAGMLYLANANREAFPKIEFDWVIVTTIYPGATAEDIEKHITISIENQLREVDGIEELYSSSLESRSVVAIKLDPDVENKEKSIANIKDAIDLTPDLPKEAEDPIVMELSTAQAPVIEISLIDKKGIDNDEDERKLRNRAKVLKERLLEIDGVAKIDKQGYRDREMTVEVNPTALQRFRIGLNSVINSLSNKNINFPGGAVKTETEDIMIRTIGEVTSAEDIENVLVAANDLGNWVNVKQIAKVKDSFAEEEIITKMNGSKAIILTVLKKEKADIITTVNSVMAEVEKFRTSYDTDYHIVTSNDMSYFVKRRLQVLINNGIVGLILVFLSLYFTLGWRISTVTAIGIPLAFCGTFIWMGVYDISINLMSMFGLIMVLGMLVDDAIVVAENVYRHIEEGENLTTAVIDGTTEVIIPVAGTIMTTIAAFAPLLFMTGIMGKFMWSLPAVVTIALLASWIESMFILPAHIRDIEKAQQGKKDAKNQLSLDEEQKTDKKTREKYFPKIQRKYANLLSAVLARRYWWALGIGILFIFSVVFAATNLKLILFPQDKIERFVVRAEAQKGTSLNEMNRKMEMLEKMIASLPENELDNYITNVGMMRDQPMDPNEKLGNNYGTIIVNLTPEEDRDRKAEQIVDWLRDNGKNISEQFVSLEFSNVRHGPPVGKAVNVTVKGDKIEQLQLIANRIKQSLERIGQEFSYESDGVAVGGLKDIKDNFEEGKREQKIYINERVAAMAGISVFDVATTVRTCFAGTVATKIKKSDEEIDIRVIFPESYRKNIKSLDFISIANRQGDLIPLREIARFEQDRNISVINRQNWKRAITVTADIDEHAKNVTSVYVNNRLQEEFGGINEEYPDVILDYLGEFKDTQDSVQNLVRSFLIAFLVIYIILVGLFRSLLHPFVIVNVIPLTFIGVIWSFYFHGMPFSFLAMMGIVGLTGVVVNDSIVLVDFIKNERQKGLTPLEASISAGAKRLRPVFLTTITTFFGLIPTAYGIGGNDPFLKPMAVSMSWGLVFGSMITLFATPILYNLIVDMRIKILKKAKDF